MLSKERTSKSEEWASRGISEVLSNMPNTSSGLASPTEGGHGPRKRYPSMLTLGELPSEQ